MTRDEHKKICPTCGQNRHHCIVSRYCVACNANIPWECVGGIKRVFISRISAKFTIYQHDVEWDIEFAPEQLLCDVPNPTTGEYFLWAQRMVENDLHDLHKESFVYKIGSSHDDKPSPWKGGVIKL